MRKEIERIIQNVTGFSKNQLFLSPEIPQKYQKEIDEKIKRLESWEPIEYIINNAEFYWLDFYVDNRVLVPRNDTEVIVMKALEYLSILDKNFILIDIWTWSSNVAISILKNTDKIEKWYAIDISKEALEVSKANIKKHKLEDKITQINSNLLDKILINNYKLNKNLLITANLPYVKKWDFENMSEETVKYEPDIALYWWEKTGFELYEKLIDQCFELKYSWYNLTLFIEIGFDQYDYSKRYLEDLNLNFIFFKDNSWLYRCIKIDF